MAESTWSPGAAPSVAVVGLACRFPEADDPPTLLDTILTGRRAFRRVPPGRLDLADVGGAAGLRAAGIPASAPRAGLIEGWQFDRAAFAVTEPAYRAAGPAHWLALETAARALAAAGFPGGTGLDRDRVGVFIGAAPAGRGGTAEAAALRWPQVRRVLAESLFAGDVRSDRARRVLRHAAARFGVPAPRAGEQPAPPRTRPADRPRPFPPGSARTSGSAAAARRWTAPAAHRCRPWRRPARRWPRTTWTWRWPAAWTSAWTRWSWPGWPARTWPRATCVSTTSTRPATCRARAAAWSC